MMARPAPCFRLQIAKEFTAWKEGCYLAELDADFSDTHKKIYLFQFDKSGTVIWSLVFISLC